MEYYITYAGQENTERKRKAIKTQVILFCVAKGTFSIDTITAAYANN